MVDCPCIEVNANVSLEAQLKTYFCRSNGLVVHTKRNAFYSGN
jgi:hypothetical protein